MRRLWLYVLGTIGSVLLATLLAISLTSAAGAQTPIKTVADAQVGVSTVLSPTTRSVNMRDCPYMADYPNFCGLIDILPNNSTVIMRCWVSATHPPGVAGTSAKWFYVNEANGPRPGYSGFIFSDFVVQSTQVETPGCTDQIKYQYYYPKPGLDFQVTGSCTTAGGSLSGQSSNFTPGGKFTVSASREDGTPYPLSLTEGTVRSDGSISWNWPCAGDTAGNYVTHITDEATGDYVDAPFTIDPAPDVSPVTTPDDAGSQPQADQSQTAPPDSSTTPDSASTSQDQSGTSVWSSSDDSGQSSSTPPFVDPPTSSDNSAGPFQDPQSQPFGPPSSGADGNQPVWQDGVSDQTNTGQVNPPS
jgi:hypothetical protein